MGEWTSGDVAANGIRLHIARTGGDKPPVVLAHGFTDAGLCWTPVAEGLAADYDVVMVDARGHGQSEAPPTGYDSGAHGGDLAGVIRALDLDKPAVLGHSMGAAATLAMAGTHPDLPGTILLEDPPVRWLPPVMSFEEQVEARRAWHATIIEGRERSRDELIAQKRRDEPNWSEAELGPWAVAKQQVVDQAFELLEPDSPLAIDWPAALRRITCPAMLITADPQRGALIAPEQAESLRSFVPQLRIAHIPGAGHNIRRDQFERYLAIVKDELATWAEAR